MPCCNSWDPNYWYVASTHFSSPSLPDSAFGTSVVRFVVQLQYHA
jgi:hypothetical protein